MRALKRGVVVGAAVLLAVAAAALATAPDDTAYQRCVDAFMTEIGAVTDYNRADCRDGLADGK